MGKKKFTPTLLGSIAAQVAPLLAGTDAITDATQGFLAGTLDEPPVDPVIEAQSQAAQDSIAAAVKEAPAKIRKADRPERKFLKETTDPSAQVYDETDFPQQGYLGRSGEVGYEHRAIEGLQKRLGLPGTSTYTEDTQKAVEDFQRGAGLPVTGQIRHAEAQLLNNQPLPKDLNRELTPRDINELILRIDDPESGQVKAYPTFEDQSYESVLATQGRKTPGADTGVELDAQTPEEAEAERKRLEKEATQQQLGTVSPTTTPDTPASPPATSTAPAPTPKPAPIPEPPAEEEEPASTGPEVQAAGTPETLVLPRKFGVGLGTIPGLDNVDIGNTVKDTGELLGNFGYDLGQVGKGLAVGAYEIGKDVVTDPIGTIGGVLDQGALGETVRAIDPPDDYLPGYTNKLEEAAGTEKFLKALAGVPGQIKEDFDNFYEHPLYPLLDVGALASGVGAGARFGGGALVNAGVKAGDPRAIALGQKMFDLNSRQGRLDAKAPTVDPKYGPLADVGAAFAPAARLYSPGLMRKGAQKVGDRIAQRQSPLFNQIFDLPGVRSADLGRRLQEKAYRRATKKGNAGSVDTLYPLRGATVAARQKAAQAPFTQVARILDDNEAVALDLLHRGISPDLLPQLQARVKLARSGRNPEDQQNQWAYRKNFDKQEDWEEYGAVFDSLTPESPVVQLMNNPSQAMRDADLAVQADVKANLPRLPITDEEHQANTFAYRAELTQQDPKTAEVEHELWRAETGNPIAPTYVPDLPARDLKVTIDDNGNLSFKDLGLGRGLKRQKIDQRNVQRENVLRGRNESYLNKNNLDLFMSGMVRLGPRARLAHQGMREEAFADADFQQGIINRFGLKDEEGEFITAKDTEEAMMITGRGDVKALPIDEGIRWFTAEHNALETVLETLRAAEARGERGVPESVEKELNALYQENAEQFSREHISAMKPDNQIILPAHIADRLEKHFLATAPVDNALGKLYQYATNKWRTAVLTYMPRWWLNTVVGTAMMSAIKGSMNPADYARAQRLIGSQKLYTLGENGPAAPLSGRGTTLADLRREADEQGDFDLATAEAMPKRPMPAGARLGFYASEGLEPQFGGMGSQGLVTNFIGEKVQSAEDFTRTASFFQALRKADRARAIETASAYDNLSGMLRISEKDDDYYDQLMQDPAIVEEALDEVNRFAYNYTGLNPFERKWMRQVIPFYGWTKFITKFMWRLPFDYPGRTLLLAHVSNFGRDQVIDEHFNGDEEAFNKLPHYRQNMLIFNSNYGPSTQEGMENMGRYELEGQPTQGLDPLASFIDPTQLLNSDTPGEALGALGMGNLGQLNPAIQGGLAMFGVDPLRGTTQFSPESGIAQDFFHSFRDPVNDTGISNPAQRFSLQRFLGQTLRAVPQIGFAERAQVGGRSVFPESIPFFDPKPINMDEKPVGLSEELTGVNLEGDPYVLDLGLEKKRNIDAGNRISSNLLGSLSDPTGSPGGLAEGAYDEDNAIEQLTGIYNNQNASPSNLARIRAYLLSKGVQVK